MKTINTFSILIFLFISLFATAQPRTDDLSLTISEPYSTFNEATGWTKDNTGKWIENDKQLMNPEASAMELDRLGKWNCALLVVTE